MPSIADVFVTVLPETSKIKEGIRKAFLEVDKEATEAGRRWGGEIQKGIGTIKADIDADTARAEAQIREVTRDRKVKVDVDTSGLTSALKLSAGLGAVGLLPALATGLVDVAGAAQQVAGAGLVLPGVFAGIFSSVGTAALGMQGMKDALDAVSKASDGTQKSVDAANKALAGLAPNAAEAVKTVAGLKGTLTDLEHIAGQNMFAGFSDGLKGLVGNLLPAATRGIDGISRGINQNLLQAMRSLGSGSSQSFLERIFGNTADAQGRLTAAIDPVIHAFGVLSAAGSDSLPRLATAVGNVADRFNNFITAADADGRLSKWINEGLTGLTQLGNIALNIGKSFTAITQAAGTGGFLTTIESATERLQTFLNSTRGQEAMKQFFDDGRVLLGQLKDIAVQLLPLLPGIFAAARDMTGLWLPVIREALQILNAIPGGAQAVVTAFLAWRTISGITTLLQSLTAVSTMLSATLPAAAATGAGGISTALAGVAVPAWLSFLVAGGSVAAVGSGLSSAHEQGLSPEINTRYPYLRNPRGGGGGSGYTGGGGGSFLDPSAPMSRSALDRIHGTDSDFAAIPNPIPPPPPVTVPAQSTYIPPVVTQPTGGGGGSSTTPGYMVTPMGPENAIALAQSVSGQPYGYGGTGDSAHQGLYDCSGFMSSLFAAMTGQTTTARFFTTESDFTKLGFKPTNKPMPGTFQIGIHQGGGGPNSHMAGTLPNNVNVESGGHGTLYGGAAAGAWDPQFEKHYYLPGSGLPGGRTGSPASALANTPSNPTYVAYAPEQYQQYKPGGGDKAGELGSTVGGDLMDLILPDGFKNPFQTGGWKFVSGLLNGLMGIKLPQGSAQGGDGASLMGGGGGGGLGGLLGGLMGITPQPFGALQTGSRGDAPGSFMPLMPNPADAQISPFQVTGTPGTAGPGNQVNNNQLVINNPVGQDHLTNMVNTAQQAQVPRVRQGVRPLP